MSRLSLRNRRMWDWASCPSLRFVKAFVREVVGLGAAASECALRTACSMRRVECAEGFCLVLRLEVLGWKRVSDVPLPERYFCWMRI